VFCEYGCGNKGKYKLKNGRYCCSESCISCPEMRKRNSEAHKGKVVSKEVRQQLRVIQLGKKHTKESKKKLKIASRSTIKEIKNKYPFFSQIEEMRYNPDRPEEKEIQVHCKNHNCPNSKEQGGWFTPTRSQMAERIRQLEHLYGNEGSYFYCSQNCKNVCPLFKLQNDPFKNTKKIYTFQEQQLWRQVVLKRENYLCEYCGEKATCAHHEKPMKTHPHLALDPDNGIACCEECHYKYGHKTGTECSTGNLASRICK